MKTIKPRHVALTLAYIACTALVGCSAMNTASNDRFACDVNRDCPTPFEVYNQTQTTPTQVRNGRTPESWKSGGRDTAQSHPLGTAGQEDLRLDLAVATPSAQMMVASDPPARPMREPSQVMRIWVAPWIDQSDTLNWSGYIYTEVTTRRWAFGEQEVRHQGMPPQFLPR